MQITDAEILELEQLLAEREIDLKKQSLLFVDENTSKNYAFLKESFEKQRYVYEKISDGFKGVILEGGARSSKTWSVLFFIIHICINVETNCTINIIRETYNEFKTTLYLDFKKILPMFGLDNPFERAKDVPSFKIGQNQINFIGADQSNKVHGLVSDYAYFNEMLPIREDVFRNIIMRCTKFWIGDFNPSVTEHWIFDKVVTRPDVGHLKTTFKDNPNVPLGQKIEILGYEPWLPGSYIVEDDTIKTKNPKTGEFEPISATLQPPPHPSNVENGTADDFMWKVYGLGLRGAMTGVIFQNITYIDEFPDMAHIYGNDFGFTADPNATVKYAEDEHNIYVELLLYEPVETPDALDSYFQEIGIDKKLPMPCDSSDKYTGENKGTVEMVRGLFKLGYTNAFKVNKNKSIMFWILSMKKKKIHIVKNHLYKYAKKEAENYRFREINGISINQPIDKHNHFWDATRYCHMSYNNPKKEYKTSSETLNSINY